MKNIPTDDQFKSFYENLHNVFILGGPGTAAKIFRHQVPLYTNEPSYSQRKAKFWSKKLLKAIKENHWTLNEIRKYATWEHVVPCKSRVIYLESMYEKKKNDINWFKNILEKLNPISMVTKEEDIILNKKYKSDMPKNWENTLDIWARYKICNIEVLELNE